MKVYRIVSIGHRALLGKAYHFADNIFTQLDEFDLKIVSVNEHLVLDDNHNGGHYFTVVISILVEVDDNLKHFIQHYGTDRTFGMAMYFDAESQLEIVRYHKD